MRLSIGSIPLRRGSKCNRKYSAFLCRRVWWLTVSRFLIGCGAQLFFCFLDNRFHLHQYLLRQWVRHMVLQYVAGFFQSPLVAVGCARRSPRFPPAAIDKLRTGVGPHMFERVIMSQEVLRRTHRLDDIDGQGFIVDAKTPDGLLDHPGKFIVQDQLGKIECDSALKHSRAVNQIGTCQCSNESGERFLMAQLGVGYFGITLPAGDITWQGIIPGQPCHCSANDGALRSAHGSSGNF